MKGQIHDGKKAAAAVTEMVTVPSSRPLSIRASHLLALAEWLKAHHGAPEVRIEAKGLRSQAVALLAAALDSTAISEVRIEKGIKSLRHLLTKPVPHAEAPELFCLGLLPEFDLERLVALAKRVRVVQRSEFAISEIETPALKRCILPIIWAERVIVPSYPS